MTRHRARSIKLATALALTWLVASPAAADSGRLSVSKTSGLKDGDQVTVKLSGWDGNIPQVDLAQCTPNARTITDCAVAETQATVLMDFGEGEATIPLRTLNTYVHCDRARDCALVAFTNPADFGEGATFVSLNFDDEARGGTAPAGGERTDRSGDGGSNKLLWALILPVGAGAALALRRGSGRDQQQDARAY